MKRPRARWLILAVLAAVLGACALIAFRHERYAASLLHFERAPVTSAMRDAAVSALGPLEDVELHTSDNLTLRGWYAPSKRRAAVVLVHGGGGNRAQLLPEATVLVAHGYGVLLYDSRASGESDGDITTWGDRERRDLTAAIDYLSKRPDVDPKRIGVQGVSIGATTVALTAASDTRARAVLLNATWSSLEDEITNRNDKYGFISAWPALWAFRHAGVDVDAVRPIDRIAEIAPRPLLIMTGDNDEDTSVAVMQRVYAKAHDPKDLWIVPGAGHGGYIEKSPIEYPRRMIAFFDAAL
jgi:dipeptidyl aminopeptidase/acylaminoacyl peptidase